MFLRASCRSKVKLIGEKKIKENLSGKGIFLVVDESIVQQRRILCILVGAIDIPCERHVLECVPISTTITSSVVCQAVDDALRFLETRRENFNLLLSDCCWWSFKINVPNHLSCNLCVTFISQLLHENTFELYGS